MTEASHFSLLGPCHPDRLRGDPNAPLRYDVAVSSATANSHTIDGAADVSHRGAALTGGVLFIFLIAAAVSVDVVQAGYKVKSDEATYVGMALSLAYDHDLSYERQDLERFWGLYGQGPEGIFLKRGKQLRIRLGAAPPFLRVTRIVDPRTDRLYFGKAMIYSALAAPFVRMLGMNGFLVFHVLLLALVCVCGYFFLVARSRPGPALMFTLAFVGAAVVPVYAVFLMADFFNFAVVFIAYFLWLYKEVGKPRGWFLSGAWSDGLAAVLLGIATYSKPSHAPLIAPLVLLLWWRRHFWKGWVVGVVFAAVAGGLYGANALVTGEFNYQGGDRKTFYGSFPFQSGRDVWNEKTELMTTNDSDAASVLAPSEFVGRFTHNVEYFFLGRHFGFVPYFFPGVVALLAWAFSRDRFAPWRVLSLAAVACATILLLLFFPYSWSGGGGPPGNRYFLSLYPTLFFLMPPMSSTAPALLAWAGGALFTAKILLNPFVSAKNTWEIAERGFARRLPVELTMANDLPVALAQPSRAHIPYGRDPDVLLYFLDRHAFPPEPVGKGPDGSNVYAMWISGAGRADIIVRSDHALDHLTVTVESPIRTTFIANGGAGDVKNDIVPGHSVTFDLPVSGVRGLDSYAYLLSAQSSDGFIPSVRDPHSTDGRNLGVLMRFQAVERR